MLCHISGLPDYNNISKDLSKNNFSKFKRLHFSNQQYVNFISDLKPVGKPKKQFYYSNFSYHLLCIILEDIYQMSYPELLKKKITSPLKLNNTICETENRNIIKNLATGYNYMPKENNWKKNNFIDLSLGRRIFSTTTDLLKWVQALNSNKILTQESISLMTKNHLTNVDSNLSYGYGWVPYQNKEKFKIGDLNIDLPYIIHGGSTEGYKAMLVNINKGEYIISFLSNSSLGLGGIGPPGKNNTNYNTE